jgi:hypothetical protein
MVRESQHPHLLAVVAVSQLHIRRWEASRSSLGVDSGLSPGSRRGSAVSPDLSVPSSPRHAGVPGDVAKPVWRPPLPHELCVPYRTVPHRTVPCYVCAVSLCVRTSASWAVCVTFVGGL